MNATHAEPGRSSAALAPPPPVAARPARLASLDAFRGATIVGMILVNNPGSWSASYPPLQHAAWHGATPTDWIFPFFLFIVGVAIPFSQAKQHPAASPIGKILRRGTILFGLGLVLHSIPYSATSGILSPHTLRIPGVLQRIAVCYVVVALLATRLGWRGMAAAGVSLMAAYTLLMLIVPAPGFAAGDLSREGNLAHYVDQTVFGAHGYRAYNDPEGILSTLPAIGTVICGWLAGVWLRRPGVAAGDKLAALFSLGVLGTITGSILDIAGMPINKQLWTPSYTIYTAGLACLGLGLCYWVIDVQGYRRWAAPLVACGMNAITIFVLAGVVGRLMLAKVIPAGVGSAPAAAATQPARLGVKAWLYETYFVPNFASPHNASLAWALCFVAIFILIAMAMHRARVYIKV